jgi:hypothetical protein
MKSGNDWSLVGVAIIGCGHSHNCSPIRSAEIALNLGLNLPPALHSRLLGRFFRHNGNYFKGKDDVLKQVAVLKRLGGICNGHPDQSY